MIGAGFAGVGALQRLAKAPVRLTLVDRNDFHTFLPLLYQVATNQLGPEDISSPLQDLLPNREGFAYLQGEVVGVDLRARRVLVEGREALDYDYLLIGVGAVVNFFRTEGASEHAVSLYTLPDASRLRSRISDCLELAKSNPELVEDGVLRFCVTGGGATGVETAGAMAELLRAEMDQALPALQPAAEVHLFEMEPHLLAPFKPRLREYARRALEQRGVQVHLGEAVQAVEPTRVHLKSGATMKAHTMVWAAGLQSTPLVRSLGLALEKQRLRAEPDLSLSGHPEVFLAGDMALIRDTKTGEQLAQLGSVAQQSGHQAGENIALLATGRRTQAFVYKDKGTMAIIGTGDAIVQLASGRTMTGKAAWLAWKGVHLMLLAGGEQKARTLLSWAKNLTGRSSRQLSQ
jgi:NADH dehydrogenase